MQPKSKTAAGASAPAMDARQLHACRDDLRAHCPGIPSGGGRLRACLEAHAAELESPCKAALQRPVDARAVK